jgi:hypothetical protein
VISYTTRRFPEVPSTNISDWSLTGLTFWLRSSSAGQAGDFGYRQDLASTPPPVQHEPSGLFFEASPGIDQDLRIVIISSCNAQKWR